MIDNFRGSLIGLVVGDALGVPNEGKSRRTFKDVNDIIGGGPFDLKPGEWTDDTSMALCLADSLIQTRSFDIIDQLERYLKWWKEGHLGVNGKCVDIGNTTKKSLEHFNKTGNPFPGPAGERDAGNGSIMRLAPVPLFYYNNHLLAIEKAGESSKTTHVHPLCIDACRYMGGLIIGGINGDPKEVILSKRFCPVPGYWDKNKLSSEIDEVASGSFKIKQPPEIQGRGFVVKSLEAALWAFYNSDNFEDGCLKAVNLGNDADTTGAVYGQIAGAYYGEKNIPKRWTKKIVKFDIINMFIENLYQLAIINF